VALFLVTKPLTCAHINYIGLSSQCRTGVHNTSCPCKLAILSVLLTTGVFFVLFVHIILFGISSRDVWTKAEEHVVKIEKEYCKENCIDRSVIEPIIIDFCDNFEKNKDRNSHAKIGVREFFSIF
jgi:hypothetical protein